MPICKPHDHSVPATRKTRSSAAAIDRAAGMFRALGDGPRLQLLQLLMEGEWCVSAIVTAMGEKFSTVSQRLRLLRQERLVVRRRAGTHIYYSLADRHVADLIQNGLAHAEEPVTPALRVPNIKAK